MYLFIYQLRELTEMFVYSQERSSSKISLYESSALGRQQDSSSVAFTDSSCIIKSHSHGETAGTAVDYTYYSAPKIEMQENCTQNSTLPYNVLYSLA